MNCQSCTARIDYRFLTSCAYCGSNVEASGVSQVDPYPALEASRQPVWKLLVNIAYTLASSGAGMISGTVTAYAVHAVSYEIFFRGSTNPHSGCGGWGMVIGLLSVYAGAQLGAVGGTLFAVKRPLM